MIQKEASRKIENTDIIIIIIIVSHHISRPPAEYIRIAGATTNTKTGEGAPTGKPAVGARKDKSADWACSLG